MTSVVVPASYGELITRLLELVGAPQGTAEIDIRIRRQEPITVTCQYYPAPNPEAGRVVEKLLGEYKLVPKHHDEGDD